MKDKWRDRSKDMAMPENNETNNLNVDDASDNPYLNQKSKKKMSKPKKVILTIVLVIVAIFIILIIAAANTPTVPDHISGIWKSGTYYIQFVNKKDFEEYVVKNGEIALSQQGTYSFNKDGNEKIKFKVDNSVTYNKDKNGNYVLNLNDNDTIEKRTWVITSWEEGKFFAKGNNGKDTEYEYDKLKKGGKGYKKIRSAILDYHAKYLSALNGKAKNIKEEMAPKEITVSTGNHICGSDFNPGTYNISLVSGSGNVSCLDSGLNEIFGTEDSDYVQSYKNAVFSEGDVLEISGNVTIKLTPAE